MFGTEYLIVFFSDKKLGASHSTETVKSFIQLENVHILVLKVSSLSSHFLNAGRI